MTFFRLCWFTLILLTSQTFASQYLDTSRLLIGFHENEYMELGGATEATDYINARWGDKKMIELVRPIGNSAILVELVDDSVANLNKVIDDLSRMPKIRFVEKDQTAGFMPEQNLNLPSIQ